VKIREAPCQTGEVYNSETKDSEMNFIRSECELEAKTKDCRSGIVVDSDRELRIKLYMGQVCTFYFPIP
jgi:phosphatidylinositol-3,4,5-trisphosphate 3-phosphatase and dual-specificity protein phosphatase PTEN